MQHILCGRVSSILSIEMNCVNRYSIVAAQGGAQGLEDAAALGELLPQGLSASKINSRLQLFEEIRRPRCTAMQTYSYSAASESPAALKGDKGKLHESQFSSRSCNKNLFYSYEGPFH